MGASMAHIHQEVVLPSAPGPIYRALLDSATFAKITGAKATIESYEGGAFTCFDGYIYGRQLELVTDRRIVQAWRTQRWPEGDWSTIRFELHAVEGGTKLVFDQHGAPEGDVPSLSAGWHEHYWEPLKKL
jgi:activator of HSP90 ATPase